MPRRAALLVLSLIVAGSLAPAAPEGDVVFRSDVALVRVDAQVVDRNGRAITGLAVEDFVLREEGRPQEIRNFVSEGMPVDILLLLDVSGSMQSHVERVSTAARQALRVLGDGDRVAIMVFDRATRLRLPFRDSRQEVERGLESVLHQETFNGGTDITRALLDAASYVNRSARPEARRAIVILTDDQTERDRDETRVSRALASADAVLSALLAPDAVGRLSRRPAPSGGSWPPSGPIGGTLGDIILGRRGPYGGRRAPGPVIVGPSTQSAGTAEIARRSGGDSLQVDDALSLQTTLERIRQRYALHFYLPDGVQPGQERKIEVELAASAQRRYPDADVRYRHVYLTPSAVSESEPTVISRPLPPGESSAPGSDSPTVASAGARGAEIGPEPSKSRGGWRRVDEPAVEEPAKEPPAVEREKEEAPKGWRRVQPGDLP